MRDRVAVKVVADESQARLISDPMRREMLRLLSRRALTEKELSKLIGLSPPSIGHHLKALTEGELISKTRIEAGGHGIVQKWYIATAQAFIVDRDHLPNDVRRYFMPIDIEREGCRSVPIADKRQSPAINQEHGSPYSPSLQGNLQDR